MRGGVGIGIPQPAPGAFVPTYLDGCLLWLRADMGITLASGKVSAWANQGSLGGSFDQGADANRPTYIASDADFQGLPSLSFDDTDDWLASSLSAASWNFLSSGTGMTVLCVFKSGGAAGDNDLLSTADAGGNGFRLTWQAAGTMVTRVRQDAGNDRRVDSALAVGQRRYCVSRYVLPGTSLSFRVAGAEGVQAGAGDPGINAPHTLAIGSLLAASSALPFGGKMAEIVAWPRVLSTDETKLIESYAASRYGL